MDRPWGPARRVGPYPRSEPTPRSKIRRPALSPDALVQIAAHGMRDSEKTYKKAEKIMATETPLPEWAVSNVLLHADLLPPIIPLLRTKKTKKK